MFAKRVGVYKDRLNELEKIEERALALLDYVEEHGQVSARDALIIMGYRDRAKALADRKRVPYTLKERGRRVG